MKILVQKRIDGVQPGGKGGWIFRGLEKVAVLREFPQQDWPEYLFTNFGSGQYHVTTQGTDGRLMKIFGGPVGRCSSEAGAYA